MGQAVFLTLALLSAGGAAGLALTGYVFFLKNKPAPLWVGRGKWILFCVFFACWAVWNLFRILPV